MFLKGHFENFKGIALVVFSENLKSDRLEHAISVFIKTSCFCDNAFVELEAIILIEHYLIHVQGITPKS